MPITTTLTNTNPMVIDGNCFTNQITVAQKIYSTASEVIGTLDTCSSGCDCAACCYSHKVFGETVYSSDLKNDRFQFMALAREDSGNVTFTMQKNGTDLFTVTDQTFGDWTDAGGYASNLRLASFYVNWGTVFRTHGEGDYQMKIVTDAIGGGTNTVYSDNFDLLPYINSNVNETVVFNWTQNGIILDNSIDFTSLNIPQWLRLPGHVGFENAVELLVEEHETAPHEFVQVQDQVLFAHVYESELLPFSVTNVILKDLILANEITVTNYNYYDHFAITEQLLKPDSVVEFKSFPYNKCAKLKIKFNNKVRNTIKRNYL